ncbi:MAG: hypothetical protein ACXVA9_08925, partial [Bdellovibrionales bacterium]
MRVKIIILIMFAGILTVAVLLFNMKGRPNKSWMIPLPPAPTAATGETKPEIKLIGGGVATL